MASLAKFHYCDQTLHLRLETHRKFQPKPVSHRILQKPPPSRAIRASSSSSSNPKPSFLKTTCVTLTTAAALFSVSLQLATKPATAATPVSPPPAADLASDKSSETDQISSRQKEEEAALEKHLSKNPNDVEALQSLMKIKFQTKNLEHALEVLNRLIEIEPEEQEWRILKAQGLKLLKGSDEFLRKIRDIGRISVTGYDTGLPHDDVVRALRKHFASCGEITDVYIAIKYDKTLWIHGYIYFLGEGAVDKALQLDGSDVVGGWKVSVKDRPFREDANNYAHLKVEGYDTSLSEDEIKSALIKLFSPYGKIKDVNILASSAMLSVYGEDAAVKAPELSGSDIGGRKVVVRLLSGLRKNTVHPRPRHGPICGRRYYTPPGKKAKTTAE